MSAHRRSFALSACVGIVIALLTTACQRTATAHQRSGDPAVSRGEYLVTVLGCGDCHTPLKLGADGPEPDLARRLSGHPEDFVLTSAPDLGSSGWVWAGAGSNTAFAGPWGITYAPNLTPDPESGLGIWTEEMFVGAMRNGKKFGNGRTILPPMPWPAYSHLTDDDLHAIFSYLMTVEPVTNHVPDWRPPITTNG